MSCGLPGGKDFCLFKQDMTEVDSVLHYADKYTDLGGLLLFDVVSRSLSRNQQNPT